MCSTCASGQSIACLRNRPRDVRCHTVVSGRVCACVFVRCDSRLPPPLCNAHTFVSHSGNLLSAPNIILHFFFSFFPPVLGKVEGLGENWHGHVTALTVAPEYRRIRMAEKMMAFLEEVSEKLFVLVYNSVKFCICRRSFQVRRLTALAALPQTRWILCRSVRATKQCSGD